MLALQNACGKKQRTRAFTLVELLVVLGIIGVLVALLIPAVQSARESARRTDCASKLKNLTLAVAHFETDRRRYPGYQEELAPGSGTLGSFARKCAAWPVLLFPYIEEQSLYDLWNDPNEPILPVDESRKLTPPLKILVCPTDRTVDSRSDTISYIANAGLFYDETTPPRIAPRRAERPQNGIFFDRYALNWQTWAQNNSVPSPSLPETRSSHFVDGKNRTLLLSENYEASDWWLTGPLSFDTESISAPNYGLGLDVTHTFHWFYATEEGAPVTNPLGQPAAHDLSILRINGDTIFGQYSPLDSVAWSRPRSEHSGGGVNAAYADGHVGFLSETIPYYVYQQLMTPDGANSDMPDPNAPHEE